MLQNALDLTVDTEVMAQDTEYDQTASSLLALEANGISLTAGETLTRGQAAETLYQASLISSSAPGMLVIQTQQ